MNVRRLTPIFFWLFPAAVITLMCGLVYGTVQQNYRQDANDPQIQMAEDAAQSLSSGSLPQLVVSQGSDVDMKDSLAPFLIIYDNGQRPVESSVQLEGQTPVPPSGVFDYLQNHEEDRFTWEPSKGVREAAVMTKYSSATNGTGFVLAARSLREVEKREHGLTLMVLIVWIIGLVISFIGINLLTSVMLRRRHEQD